MVLPEQGYDPIKQLLRNNWPVLLKQLWGIPVAALMLLLLLGLGVRRLWHRRRPAAPVLPGARA